MTPGSVFEHFLRETAVEMLQNKGGKGIAVWCAPPVEPLTEPSQ